MILPSDKEYLQTQRIVLGESKMKAEFIPLAELIDQTYDVKTILLQMRSQLIWN